MSIILLNLNHILLLIKQIISMELISNITVIKMIYMWTKNKVKNKNKIAQTISQNPITKTNSKIKNKLITKKISLINKSMRNNIKRRSMKRKLETIMKMKFKTKTWDMNLRW